MRPLEGWVISAPASRAASVCERQLRALGCARAAHRTGNVMSMVERGGRHEIMCDLAAAPLPHGCEHLLLPADAIEPFAQAVCGLMAVHGRDDGRPRRLGLDVASDAAGALAATGLLAAALARRRGLEIASVATSHLAAGLTFLTHQIAMATCSDGWAAATGGDGPGPPFTTGDGVVFEMEAASRDGWVAFWCDLGTEAAVAAGAWPAFVDRYNTAQCALPRAVHATVRGRTFDEISRVALTHRMSISRLRTYEQVLESRDWVVDGASGAPGDVHLAPRWMEHALPSHPSHTRGASHTGMRVPPASPFDGIRVVESTHGLPGPLAGQLLRMLGAEVIRIEPPGGDPGRTLRPAAGAVSAGFLSYNREKRVVELDYKSAAGRRDLADLAVGADVFLHNWLPDRAETYGFDAATLARHNPRLVHSSISGWGGARDAAERVGVEYFVQAHCGCADGLSPLGTAPAPSRLILAGVMAALLACEAIVAALCDRERSGRGRALETSLFLGAMALQADVLLNIATGHEDHRRCGRPVWDALDLPLRTGSGHVVLAVHDDDSRRRLFDVCGVDPSSPNGDARLLEALAARTAGEWEAALLAVGVPCATVREDLAALPADPLVGSSLENAGDCAVPASPWAFHL